MPRKKSVKDYEHEAAKDGKCLVHPNKHSLARKIYIMRHGPLPPDILVCHKCDNPPCILDRHHFTGTNLDNALDSAAKGRKKHKASTIENLRAAAQRRFENESEEERNARVAICTAAMNRPDVIEKNKRSSKKRYEDQAEHEKLSKGQLRRFESPEERLRNQIAQKKSHGTTEARERNRQAQLLVWSSAELRAQASVTATQRYKNPIERKKTSTGLKHYYATQLDAHERNCSAQNRPDVQARRSAALKATATAKSPEERKQGWAARRANMLKKKGANE